MFWIFKDKKDNFNSSQEYSLRFLVNISRIFVLKEYSLFRLENAPLIVGPKLTISILDNSLQ